MTAKNFALKHHGNQKYDNSLPYEYHLQRVVDVANDFELWPAIVDACWLHDIIEDTDVNYHAIKSEFGEVVAELVYAVTDELGRNRKERKLKTYPKLIGNTDALKVKLCDRIANVEYTLGGSEKNLAGMYTKEFPEFFHVLYNPYEARQDQQLLGLWERLYDAQLRLREKTRDNKLNFDLANLFEKARVS